MHKFRQKYIGDKAFYKRYLMLAIPMIIQNAITNLVSFLDNIMVGQLGTEQMSGVAIVNQLIFVYNLAVFGAVSAASIFGAQYFGKGNHKGHMYSFRFKLYAALLVTAIAMTLFITNGTGFISLYLTDTAGNGATEVALAYGKEYLEIVMIGLIPFAVTQAYATNIKETGQTFVPMVASFAAVGSNAVLDYLFYFRNWTISKIRSYWCSTGNCDRTLHRSIYHYYLGTFPQGEKQVSGRCVHRIRNAKRGIEGNYYQRLPTYVQRGFMGSRHDNRYPVLFHSRIGSCGRS